MIWRRLVRGMVIQRGGWPVLAVCLLCRPALAQTAVIYNPTSAQDVYGNVRPVYQGPRLARVFQNELQRAIFRTYQPRRVRMNQQRGVVPFALPGDMLRRRPGATPMTSLSPIRTSNLRSWQRRAYQSYGGFGERSRLLDAGTAAAAVERRRALIEATGLSAPLNRARARMDSPLGLRATVEQTPFPEQTEGEPATHVSSLDRRLRGGLDTAYQRTRQEAWAWFEEGQYRRASRAFEAAKMLEPLDIESRVGELFCHLSLGASRTSLALVAELGRRDVDPFLPNLDVTNAYGGAGEAQRVRIQLQLQVGAARRNADLRALHALVLWYVGERDEAVLVATNLVADIPGTTYDGWPAKMRVAKAGPAAGKDQPRP